MNSAFPPANANHERDLITAHGDEIKVNGQQLASQGSSAGGEMTAILALMAKDKGGSELEFQVMRQGGQRARLENTPNPGELPQASSNVTSQRR